MNANLTKLGKRKNKPGQQHPDWLFPSTHKVAVVPPPAPPAPPAPAAKSEVDPKMTNKKAKKIAKDLLKRRAAGEPTASATQSPLAELIGAYLIDNNYTLASQAFKAERAKRGERMESVEGTPSLDAIFVEWLGLKGLSKDLTGIVSGVPEASNFKNASSDDDVEMADAPPVKKTLKKSTSSSSSSSSSDSSSSGSSTSSDSDADDEKEQGQETPKASLPKAKSNVLKRKAPSSSSSSSSGSSSSNSSSSDSDAPKTKKTKTSAVKSASSVSSSGSSDSDSSSDSDVHESKVIKESSKSSSSNSSSSSSDSDSDSEDSDSSTHSIARKLPLPASDSESDSDTSSSDSDSPSTSKNKDKKQTIGSDTSATLSDGPKKKAGSSSDSSSDSSSSSESGAETKSIKVVNNMTATATRALSPPLPPNPVAKGQRKKVNEPFQRIKSDVKVDERLASNAYVPYDYAQKAHEDLIVTRGKGFTKEKNKKKRGSYRGGYIDVEGKKGIKFDD